jgi:hypothetical protein
MKSRGISINDEMYNVCIEIAGPRNFSVWIRDLLQTEINRYRSVKGRVPGGACDSGLGCANAGAWYLHTLKHNYWCKECFSKSNSQYLFIDKAPVRASNTGDQREQLIEAVKNACAALLDFDASSPLPCPAPHQPESAPVAVKEFDRISLLSPAPAKTSNLPIDLATAIASTRDED